MESFNKSKLKIKIIALIYGFTCHSTFFLAGSSMIWVLYNGFTVSFGYFNFPFNIISNFFLLIQFPLLHSFLLSCSGRKILRLFSPKNFAKTLETTNYAIIASIQLLLLFLLWSPSNIIFYDLKYPYNIFNSLLFVLSWILLTISSFQAGYQVQTGSLGWTSMFFFRKPVFPPMPTKGFFKFIRHPIYFSFCLVLWTPPTMTLDLFLVALTYSLYCFFAPRFKEKRFVKIYGKSFVNYKKNTPYFFPIKIQDFLKKK